MTIDGNWIEVTYIDAGGTTRTASANVKADAREEEAKNLLKEMAEQILPDLVRSGPMVHWLLAAGGLLCTGSNSVTRRLRTALTCTEQ